MKRMIFPSLFSTASITAFSRSSNSPRYFAQAIIAVISSVRISRSRSISGTSRATIFRAIPSTIAVFPTPGSHTSTGLFFERRERIWIVRYISSSRPMTGSIFPSRACSVRFMVNISSGLRLSAGSKCHSIGKIYVFQSIAEG